jgi:HEAT repeat protein
MQKIADGGETGATKLIPLLKDHDWKVRYRAAEACGIMRAEKTVPFLITACHDEKDHVRYMAAKSLGLVKNSDAVPVLIELLTDEHLYTRGIASEGLATIQDPRAVLPLENAIQSETDPNVRLRMEKCLTLLQKKTNADPLGTPNETDEKKVFLAKIGLPD